MQAGNKQGCWQQGWYWWWVAEWGPFLPPQPLQLLVALPAPRGAPTPAPCALGCGQGCPQGCPCGVSSRRGVTQPLVLGAGLGVPGSRWGGGQDLGGTGLGQGGGSTCLCGFSHVSWKS